MDELEQEADDLGLLQDTTEYGHACANCGDPVPDDTPRKMNLGVGSDGKYCSLICRMDGGDN